MVIRTLFVTSFSPFPIERTGGAIRSRHLIDALRQCGPVHLLYLNYRGLNYDIAAAAAESISAGSFSIAASIVVTNDTQNRLARALDQIRRAYSFAFGSGVKAAGLRTSVEALATITGMVERGEVDLIVGRLTRPTVASGMLETSGVPLIVDADDWEPSRTAAQIMVTPRHNILRRLFLRRLSTGSRNMASDVLSRADHVWLASDTDTRAIARSSATTLPNLPLGGTGAEIAAVGRSSLYASGLFTVGDWGKAQNADGMSWFLKNVWPAILSQVPSTRLRIAGGMPQNLMRAWGGLPNVDALGFVEDLRPEYEGAALALAPITWGGGTKVKVLEALAYGRVPAGPEHAFDGLLDAELLRSVAIVENDASTLATEIVNMLRQPDERHCRERASLDYYHGAYSVASFRKHVSNTVNLVMERGGKLRN